MWYLVFCADLIWYFALIWYVHIARITKISCLSYPQAKSCGVTPLADRGFFELKISV
jgi:hypothetical protein